MAGTRYRVWWIPQVPMKAFYTEVSNIRTAIVITQVLARYDLFQFENNVKPDYANVGGIQRWDEKNECWEDVHDDDEELSDDEDDNR